MPATISRMMVGVKPVFCIAVIIEDYHQWRPVHKPAWSSSSQCRHREWVALFSPALSPTAPGAPPKLVLLGWVSGRSGYAVKLLLTFRDQSPPQPRKQPRPASLRKPGLVAEGARLPLESCECGSRIAPGVGTEHLEIVAAEEGSRVLDVDQAHAAAHLLHRDVLVLCHPGLHARQHHADVLDAVLQQGRGHHGDVRAGHHGLQHVAGVVHAAGDGDVGFDLVVEDGGPVQPEAQLMWLLRTRFG